MRTRLVRAVAGVAIVVAGGVAASAASAASTLPLPARVLHAGDFLGLRPQGPVAVVRSPELWALDEPQGAVFDAALLRKDGFAGGIFEHLHWQARNIDGLSVVVQLGSAADARRYVTIYNGLATPFSVSGMPGARGFGDQGGVNVVFADADYAYLVGAGWQPGATHTVTKAQVIVAAKLLYHRVHDH